MTTLQDQRHASLMLFANKQRGRRRQARAACLALLMVVALVASSACRGTGEAGSGSGEPTIIFAAASLTDAFEALGAVFAEARPEQEILFNFAGSQQLAQQITEGAPGHVFASADLTQMEQAVASGRIHGPDVQPFAANRLAVIYPTTNPAQIDTLHDLTQAGLRLVLAAEEVPVGRYTHQFLEKASATALGADYRRRVLDNVVSYELNVRAVLTKVSLGEADAGIVYESDLVGNPDAQLERLEIPTSLNVEAHYFIAPIDGAAAANGGPQAGAAAFIDFVLSTEGQQILQQYGLARAPEPALE